jgi:hypothetical protein
MQFGGARQLTSRLAADPSSEAEPRRVDAAALLNANWTTAERYMDLGGARDKILEETGPVAS